MGMPMSKLVMSFSAITAATIVWYSWPVKKRTIVARESKYPILGLENVGSSCFLNAILQALASLQNFEKWLAMKDIDNAIKKEEMPQKFHGLKYPVIAILYRTVLVVNHVVKKDEYVMSSKLPVMLANVLRRKGQNIMLTEEQDAVEIMQLIFCAVNDDMIFHAMHNKQGSLACFESECSSDLINLEQRMFEDNCSESAKNAKSHYIFPSEQLSVAYHVHGLPILKMADSISHKSIPPYKGLIASKLECIGCFKKNAISTESFDVLSLSLPTGELRALTLNKLIENYIKPTFVHAVDCDECSRLAGGPTKSTFVKSLAFGRIPKVICFHLMRTSWSGVDGRMFKRLDHVIFLLQLNMSTFKSIKDLSIVEKPEETTNSNQVTPQDLITNILKMNPMCLENLEPYYELKAVICHEGGVENGHYITLRRCPVNKHTRYNVSDDIINIVSTEYVLSCRAYVLFYEYVSKGGDS